MKALPWIAVAVVAVGAAALFRHQGQAIEKPTPDGEHEAATDLPANWCGTDMENGIRADVDGAARRLDEMQAELENPATPEQRKAQLRDLIASYARWLKDRRVDTTR